MNLPLPPPRGPYLQMGTDTGIHLRWRTDSLTDSRVRFGDAPDNLSFTIDDPAPVTNHEVPLTGLTPDTLYYYSVGSSASVFSGGDSEHFFRTSPVPGARAPSGSGCWAILGPPTPMPGRSAMLTTLSPGRSLPTSG